jgi:hypothetical protein
MAKDDELITVTVVISGQPQSVRVNVHERVETLVRKALQDSGNTGQPPGDWELRTVEGALIGQDQRIDESGIRNGATLFLAPRAGVGG